MTATLQPAGDAPAPHRIARLWHRQLDHYPEDGPRFLSLGIVVATTVVLYYQLYLAGGVATQIISGLHMSFLYFVNITVIGYAFGALAAITAGLTDRYGRANVVTAGLAVTGVLSLAVLPHVHSKLSFAITYVAIGFVEGIVLVATPALIRDFSPQLGRASAMGFWTLGPVLGSLVVSAIVTNTSSHTWQWQYGLAGIIGLVVCAVSLLGLRELAPKLRDQLMVSRKDRVLIEARAKGLDVEAALARPFRQMLHLDIVGSAFAISAFLTIYYIAVGFFPIFFETVFGYSASRANGLGNYFWTFDAAALLIVGVVSDLVRVRKPFMVLGALSAIVFTSMFAIVTTHPRTTHTEFILLLIGTAVSLGVAFAPWMASFTETVERRNPALTATGLAVWGLIIRVVIALVLAVLPHVVTKVSTVVDKGGAITAYEGSRVPVQTAAGATTVGSVVTAVAAHAALVGQVQAAGAQYSGQLATLQKLDPATAATLAGDPTNLAAGLQAVADISGVPLADVRTIATHSAALTAAATLDSATALTLVTHPADRAAGAKAVGEIVAALHVPAETAQADLRSLASIPDVVTIAGEAPKAVTATTQLRAAAAVPASVLTLLQRTAPAALGTANFAALSAVGTPAGNPELTTAVAYLGAHGAEVQAAVRTSASQWRTYFWVGVGGQVVFIPLIFLMAGFWSPRKARRAEQEHEAMVTAELARLPQA